MATCGSQALDASPLPEQGPVGVLARKGEEAVAEAEQLALLVVDESRAALALSPALHLEVVDRAGPDPAQVGLAALLELSHTGIVPRRAKAAYR
jgi:hypothetical protein